MWNSSVCPRKRKSPSVIIAAGRIILKFSRNLSRISQPCVFTAAMVVSEMMDRLSPNIAPQTTAAAQIAIGKPVFSLIPAAIGASAVMVPTEVPIEMEIKQPMTKSPATAMPPGRIDRPRLTVLSTPPEARTAPEKAPAARKIRHMVRMFSSPAPLEAICSFCTKLSFLFCIKATMRAIRKPTMAGIL